MQRTFARKDIMRDTRTTPVW